MKKYISLIIKILIFVVLILGIHNIESAWYNIPMFLLAGWFGYMISNITDLKEKIKGYKTFEYLSTGFMIFKCWDKEKKKYWGDFRIHPQGLIAPATSSDKDGYWVYDWDYDQKKLVLYVRTKNKKIIKIT